MPGANFAKVPSLSNIIAFLDREFKTRETQDDAYNGLQNSGAQRVQKIALAVDASLETFQLAQKAGAQMLIVHHGLYWKSNPPNMCSQIWKNRLLFLSQNSLSLYALHLPLDLHPALGNNAQICGALGLGNKKKFGEYRGIAIGFSGELGKTLSIPEFEKLLSQKIARPHSFLFGKKSIRTTGVVSGGGAYAIEEAAARGLDCMVTGEMKHSAQPLAKECGMNVFACGHYATETFGVKAVGKILERKFGVECKFVDAPTGL